MVIDSARENTKLSPCEIYYELLWYGIIESPKEDENSIVFYQLSNERNNK